MELRTAAEVEWVQVAQLRWRVIEWVQAEGIQLLFVSSSELSAPFYKRAGIHMETDSMNLELEVDSP